LILKHKQFFISVSILVTKSKADFFVGVYSSRYLSVYLKCANLFTGRVCYLAAVQHFRY